MVSNIGRDESYESFFRNMKQHGTSLFKFGDDEGDSLVIRRGKPIKIDVDPADIEINYKGNNVTDKWNIKQDDNGDIIVIAPISTAVGRYEFKVGDYAITVFVLFNNSNKNDQTYFTGKREREVSHTCQPIRNRK